MNMMKREGSWDALDWTEVPFTQKPMDHGMDEFLLPSEEIITEGHGVVLVNIDVAGTLFITNFRLLFVSEGKRKLIPLGTIPLATIEKFSKQVARVVPPSRQGERTPTQRLLQVVGKDMRIILFGFRPKSRQRRVIFEELTRRMRSSCLWDLYAFACGPLKFKNSESDPRKRLNREYLRLLGKINTKTLKSINWDKIVLDSNITWRITDVNSDYSVCSSYPSLLIVPTSVSDEEVRQAATFRSRGRLPVITWCHPVTGAALGRSSQPLVGLMMNMRSNADEKLVTAFCKQSTGSKEIGRKLYIADARPRKNAFANGAMGGGSENSSNYSQSEVVFFGIDNIHAMRDSFVRLRDYLDTHGAASSDGLSSFMRNNGWTWGGGNVSSMSASVSALGDSGWLIHIHSVLVNSVWIAARIALEKASVLVHCSDGWDRTTQLVSLASLLLDPYYRTFEGFQALVEKDWLAFGHHFADRLGMPTYSGFLNSSTDSFRQTGSARKTGSPIRPSPGSSFTPSGANNSSASLNNNYSPIFVQWVECVAQLLRMYPCAFEFSSAFLVDFLDGVISCRFGNFLCNSEKERQQAGIEDGCGCIWSYLSQLRMSKGGNHEHCNLFYDSNRHSGPLLPAPAALAPSLWPQFHLRWACPSDPQGELEMQCRMMAQKFSDLQKAKQIAEENTQQMAANLQKIAGQLESEKRSRQNAASLASRACRETVAIKRAVESIGCKIQFSSHSPVADLGNPEDMQQKVTSILSDDREKRKSHDTKQEDPNDLSVSISISPESDLSANLIRRNCDGICPFRTGESCKWPDAACLQMGSQFTGLRANYDAFDRLSIYDCYFQAEGQQH